MQPTLSSWGTRASGLAVALALGVSSGCAGDDTHVQTRHRAAAVDAPFAVDILFVIDNSGSMREEQESLAANFDLLIDELATLPGGLPSLHIGVVSTDTGAGAFDIPGCVSGGDGGALHDTAQVPGCTPPADAFISDVILSDGSREQNYTGTLGEAFQCVGLIGTAGCGFEQPLESMRQALDSAGAGQPNAGFLRDDAYLAVIVISDEDDCSAQDAGVFDPAQSDIGDPLGPLSSFRCYEFGVRCDGQVVARADGTYAACEPRGDSFLHDPDGYVGFLTSLKANPNHVFVGVIAGDTGPLTVAVNALGNPEVAASCSTANGSASPAYRLRAFAEAFDHNLFTSICSPDLDVPVADVAQELKLALLADDTEPAPEPGTPSDAGGCQTGSGGGSSWLLLALGLIAAGMGRIRRSRRA